MNLVNLRRLSEVGHTILDEGLAIGFGTFECATFACLAGWYHRMVPAFDLYAKHESPLSFDEILRTHFGLPQFEVEVLFGTDDRSRWWCDVTGQMHLREGGNAPGYGADQVLRSRLVYLDDKIRKEEVVIQFEQATQFEAIIPDNVIPLPAPAAIALEIAA